jgi:hypothetical protein
VIGLRAPISLLLLEPVPAANDDADLAPQAGSWELDFETGEYVLSPRGRELLGIRPGEPVTIERLLAALHPGDLARWQQATEAVLDPEGDIQCTIEFRTADPLSRWLVATGHAVFDGTRAVRVAGTLREVAVEKARTR